MAIGLFQLCTLQYRVLQAIGGIEVCPSFFVFHLLRLCLGVWRREFWKDEIRRKNSEIFCKNLESGLVGSVKIILMINIL